MTNEERATMAAELESTKNALQAAREELESGRDREKELLDTLKEQAKTLSETSAWESATRRYTQSLILIAIAALAAWQVYLTLQLRVLLT